MNPRIADYIRANRRKYTRDAITKQLLEAGHDPADVERTWAALDAPDADQVAGEGFWGRFAVILIGVNVGVFLVVGLLTGMLQNLPSSSVILVILAVAMGIGALMAWGLVAATGPAKLGRTTALAIGIAIPALFALLIGGSCYALIGSIGGMGSGGGPAPVNATMEVRLEGGLDVVQASEGFCQLEGDSFFLNGEVTTPDGMVIFISVNSFGGGSPGGGDEASLFIEAPLMGAPETFAAWGTEQGSEADAIDWSLGESSGSVTFTGLPGIDQGKPGAGAIESLDGEISWSCN